MKPTEYKGIYAGSNAIRIEFMYQAVRCRETIRGTPTKTRLQEVARKREQILYEIDMGKFDYAEHFPSSKMALKFSNNKAAFIRMSEAVDMWFHRNSKRWARSTYRGYVSKVNTHILPNFGKMMVADFKPYVFKDWAASTKISAKSVNEVRSILHGILKELVFDEILESNPIDKCPAATKQRTEPVPFDAKEREAIINALPEGYGRDFYIFAFWTGLRTGEQLGLQWGDFDIEKRRIYIRRSIVHGKLAGTKTNSSFRTHELSEQALDVLLRIKSTHPNLDPEARIFLDPRTMLPWKYDGIMRERFWTPALKQAQVKYRRPYNCRHTYASTMLTARKDPTWLAKQMGHKDWGMIRMVYARWIDN